MKAILPSVAVMLVVACGGGGGGSTTPAVVSTLTVIPAGPALDTLYSLGETVQLNVVARDANGAVVNATISYVSGNPDVATVNNSGRIIATGNGATSVMISSGSVSEQRGVRVRQRVASITLSPTAIVLAPGLMRMVTAQARDARGNNIPGLPAAVFTSDNDGVVITNAGGVLTGQAEGNTTVTASITTADGTTMATVAVQVLASLPLAATVTLINDSFNPNEVLLGAGGTVTFTNAAGVTHNVTFFAAEGAPENVPDHSSGENQRQFPVAGTFEYRCTIHSGMSGTVIAI
jgi:plastocyanin